MHNGHSSKMEKAASEKSQTFTILQEHAVNKNYDSSIRAWLVFQRFAIHSLLHKITNRIIQKVTFEKSFQH